MRTVSIGLIGCGLWGPNLARGFGGTRRAELTWICDIDRGKLDSLGARLKGVRATTDYAEILADGSVDAVAVATPSKAHYDIAHAALSAGKHVLVEKPLTDRAATSRELTELARSRKLTLMTGYVFLFNSGIHRIHEMIRSGELGEIQYMDAARTNLGPIRGDVSALWDLGSHDISIFLHWMDQIPVSVSASGGQYLGNSLEDVVVACLRFNGGQVGIILASWLNPCKVRRITVVGTKKMAGFDDMSPSEPVRLYDKGVVASGYYDSYGSHRLAVRSGDILLPSLKIQEPLSAEIEAFLDAVLEGKVNPGIGNLPVRVALVLEAAEESIRRSGSPVEVRREH
jgi:predicted dehydrogenase